MPRAKVPESESPVVPRVTAVVQRRDIITKRLENPFAGGSLDLPCAARDRQGQPLLTFRVVNGEIAPDHTWRTISVKGWEYATPADIRGNPTDYGFELRDGRLVRGVRGQEVLVKMALADFRAIQAAKAQRNIAAVEAKATKQAIVAAASSELGDEPADFLHRTIQHVEITDSRERVPDAQGYTSTNE